MSGAEVSLFIAVLLACIVEAVEATTIVLAAGTARDWRSALQGVGVALLALAAITAVLGPSISHIDPSPLRLVVGAVLLIFGLQWLRKAILRASGYKALHDEDKAFREEVAAARAAQSGGRGAVADWYGFTLCFKGTLLEGLEVVMIVLTFGANAHNVPLASLAGVIGVVAVVIAGVVVRKPLSRVPENTMKFTVAIMLTGFGIFWGAEGAMGTGHEWPGKDAALLWLIPAILVFSLATVAVLRQVRTSQLATVIESQSA